MQYQEERTNRLLVTSFSILVLSLSGSSVAQQGPGGGQSMNVGNARVVEYWTSERRANAIPRDLVIDSRGLGYLRRPDGSLRPHGHQIAAENSANGIRPNAKPPGGGSDKEPPDISDMDPDNITIGASYTFSATITDESAIKSVYFTIIYPNGFTTQSFLVSPPGAGDTWSLDLTGFFDGDWQWYVSARDDTNRGGNSIASPFVPFTVGGGSEPPPPPNEDILTNEEWTDGGPVQTAAGRIYFEMPENGKGKKKRWVAYVCSGTSVADTASDRSIILTAAHCVYDDTDKAFARNILFIPDQAGTSGSGTDQDCSNDPIGCWTPSFGVVDTDWATSTFPANKAYDYGYYVVSDQGAHSPGINPADDRLAVAAGTLTIEFSNSPYVDDGTPGAGPESPDFTHALGYSYNADPNFMFCAEDMTTEGPDNWWLPSCRLSGGSSGGPWLQPMTNGDGPVISVNSWGYVGSPGMAGPILFGTSAECVFTAAVLNAWLNNPDDGDAGFVVNCP